VLNIAFMCVNFAAGRGW